MAATLRLFALLAFLGCASAVKLSALQGLKIFFVHDKLLLITESNDGKDMEPLLYWFFEYPNPTDTKNHAPLRDYIGHYQCPKGKECRYEFQTGNNLAEWNYHYPKNGRTLNFWGWEKGVEYKLLSLTGYKYVRTDFHVSPTFMWIYVDKQPKETGFYLDTMLGLQYDLRAEVEACMYGVYWQFTSWTDETGEVLSTEIEWTYLSHVPKTITANYMWSGIGCAASTQQECWRVPFNSFQAQAKHYFLVDSVDRWYAGLWARGHPYARESLISGQEYCADACGRGGYDMAGLMDDTCFCNMSALATSTLIQPLQTVDFFNVPKEWADEDNTCWMPCMTDIHKTCGGIWDLFGINGNFNINYITHKKHDMSSTRFVYLGCFEDLGGASISYLNVMAKRSHPGDHLSAPMCMALCIDSPFFAIKDGHCLCHRYIMDPDWVPGDVHYETPMQENIRGAPGPLLACTDHSWCADDTPFCGGAAMAGINMALYVNCWFNFDHPSCFEEWLPEVLAHHNDTFLYSRGSRQRHATGLSASILASSLAGVVLLMGTILVIVRRHRAAAAAVTSTPAAGSEDTTSLLPMA